jgi:hypothetical protein
MQPAFAARILRGAKELGIHTAIDTSGYLGAAASDAMLDDVDLVLLDVKSGDPETYRRSRGASSNRRWSSVAARPPARRARGVDPLRPRPGPDRRRRQRREGRAYAASLNEIAPDTVTRVEVLPFHQMGRDKWARSARVPPRRHRAPSPNSPNACASSSARTASHVLTFSPLPRPRFPRGRSPGSSPDRAQPRPPHPLRAGPSAAARAGASPQASAISRSASARAQASASARDSA